MKYVLLPSLRCFRIPLLVVLAAVSAGGCGREEAVAPAPVEWPELVRFDGILREAEQLVRAGDTVAALTNRQLLLEAGWAVAPPTVPANVADMEKVRPLLGDLVSKLNGLAVSSLAPEKLEEIVIAIRPILNELYEASGVDPARPSAPDEGLR